MEDREHQALVNSLVSQYAEIDKLAASIMEDKQQVQFLLLPIYMCFKKIVWCVDYSDD